MLSLHPLHLLFPVLASPPLIRPTNGSSAAALYSALLAPFPFLPQRHLKLHDSLIPYHWYPYLPLLCPSQRKPSSYTRVLVLFFPFAFVFLLRFLRLRPGAFLGDVWSFILRRLDPPPFYPLSYHTKFFDPRRALNFEGSSLRFSKEFITLTES